MEELEIWKEQQRQAAEQVRLLNITLHVHVRRTLKSHTSRIMSLYACTVHIFPYSCWVIL